MALRYNANLVSEGALKDSKGNKIVDTYATKTELENKSEVFVAEYGTTTFEEIQTAYNAGEAVFCEIEKSNLVPLTTLNNDFCMFTKADLSDLHQIICSSSNSWARLSRQVQSTSNLVTSLTSSSTDTKYPSAKCVYNALQPKLTMSDLPFPSGQVVTKDEYSKFVEYMAAQYQTSVTTRDIDDDDHSDMTSNGVMGGAEFAVSSDPANTDFYKGFDGYTFVSFTGDFSFTLYFPEPTKLTEFKYTIDTSADGFGSDIPSAVNVYGSNDGSTWSENIGRGGLVGDSLYMLHIYPENYYKYYKFSVSVDGYTTFCFLVWEGETKSPTGVFTTEKIWQETYSRFGVCNQYVYDEVAETLRMPKRGVGYDSSTGTVYVG